MNPILSEDLSFYWFLQIFLIMIFIGGGIIISKYNKDYNLFKIVSCFIIVTFSLIVGLRWERGTDYYNYYSQIVLDYEIEEYEPLYKLLILFWRTEIIPYWTFFVFCSGLFITSFLCVIKHYRSTAFIALPLFLLITQEASENLVRQYIGISIFLFGFSAYLNGQKKLMTTCFIILPLIHLTGLIPLIFIYPFYKIKFSPKVKYNTIIILLAIYLLLNAFWDIENFSFIPEIFKNVTFQDEDAKFTTYFANSERWLTEEGSLSKVNETTSNISIIITISSILLNCIIIYYGYKLCKLHKSFRIIFCFTYTSIIIFTIAHDIELYRRIGHWFYFFIPLLLGSTLYYLKLKSIEKAIIYVTITLVYIYPFIRFIGEMPYSGCAFIWDKV